MGKGRDALFNPYITLPAAAQPANISQVPHTAFALQQPPHQPSPQSVDPLAMANLQSAALDSAASPFAQLVILAAANLGLTFGASAAQDSLGLGQPNATIAPADLAHGYAGAAVA